MDKFEAGRNAEALLRESGEILGFGFVGDLPTGFDDEDLEYEPLRVTVEIGDGQRDHIVCLHVEDLNCRNLVKVWMARIVS